jgi:integrase
VRDVPALPPVVEAVRAYRASLPTPPIGGLMFAADGGGCHGPSYTMAWTDKSYRRNDELRVRRGWASRAGIRQVTFHALRHTCGTHLLMGTWEQWTGKLEMKHVSAWLGHSSEQVTRKHYAQFSKDALTNMVQQVLMARPRRNESEGT